MTGSSQARFRPTVARIDLAAVKHNCRAIRALLPQATSHLVVVKADGYGHGATRVAAACLEAGADWLGVALVEEGLELRRAGIRAPILILVEPPAGSEDAVVAGRLAPSVGSRDALRRLEAAASRAGLVHPVHVAVDTGMHREGVADGDVAGLAAAASSSEHLELDGVWTHLALADDELDPFTSEQERRFDDVLARLHADGIAVRYRHMANSPGILRGTGTGLDLVRSGVAVYGLSPASWQTPAANLRPAMQLVSAVCAVRHVREGEGVSYGHRYRAAEPTTVASVPIGYGDGYPRHLSGLADVLIGGRRRRVAGVVTMDQIMVECGSDDVRVGDEVVLLGSQDGETVSADELAERAGTINYEIVTRIGPRVPRDYVDGDD